MNDTAEDNLIYLFSVIGSSLSVVGCLFILLTFMMFTSLRQNHIFRSVIFLVIIDLFISLIGYAPLIIPVEDGNVGCIVIAFFDNLSRLSSLFWTAIFAKILQQMIMEEKQMTPNRLLILLMCVVIPFAISIIPLILGFYGSSGVLCWIRISLPKWDEFAVAMAIYFGYFLLIFAYNLFVHLKTLLYIRRMIADSSEFYQLLFYPMILLVCNSVGLANRVYISFWDGNSVELRALTAFLFQIQGFLNAMAYGLNYKVRTITKEYLIQLCTSEISRSNSQRSTSNKSMTVSVRDNTTDLDSHNHGRLTGKKEQLLP